MESLREDWVLETEPTLLTTRVNLPWREVKRLGEVPKASERIHFRRQGGQKEVGRIEPRFMEPTLPLQEPPARGLCEASTLEPTLSLEALSEADRKALLAQMAPKIEALVVESVKALIATSLSNALSRTRLDVERSIPLITADAVKKALEEVDWSTFRRT